MTAKQRAHYFRDLWPAACAAQGWEPRDDAMRRDVTLEATGNGSTGKLTQPEVTKLFDFLKLLADPTNLDRAILVANPDVAEEADRRRQHLNVIDALGFAHLYVARCALGFCRAAKVSTWRDLPSAVLEKLRHTLTTRARQRDAEAKQRPAFIPRSEPYHRRESTRRKKAAEREPQVVPRPGTEDLLPF